MFKWLLWLILGVILVAAAVLRFTGLDWDEYNHYHPDERYISWVGTTIEAPGDWSTALDPHQSTFNPFYWPPGAESRGIVVDQDEQRRFAYGHFPLYMGVAATRVSEWLGPIIMPLLPSDSILQDDILNAAGRIEYRHLTAVGRALTALVDTISVLLVFILGKQLFGPIVGLLAAAFMALNVMHIQMAHFFVVDPYLGLFGLASLSLMVAAAKSKQDRARKILFLFSAAAAVGLAVGAKFNGILLLAPLFLTIFFVINRKVWFKLLLFAGLVTVALVVFSITNPFAVLDFSCDAVSPSLSVGPIELPSINWRSCYLMNVGLQSSMVRGTREVPFVRQYLGTLPFLYYLEMQIKWGMGLPLGIAAFSGFIWAIWRTVAAGRTWWRGRKAKGFLNFEPYSYSPNSHPVTASEGIVASWMMLYVLLTGLLTVKFMRYMMPVSPVLMIYAAAVLYSIPGKLLKWLTVTLILLATAIYTLSFVAIYDQPHPWIEASRWLYDNVDPNSKILSEMWDDSLPDNITYDGQTLERNRFDNDEVNWLSATGGKDNGMKLEENLEKVASSDVIVLASNRNYGVIPRLSSLYPLSSQYYPLLFDGSLGFELSYVGTRTPHLLGVHLLPDSFNWPGLQAPNMVEEYLDNMSSINLGRFDESFTVYDQPLVMVFKNKAMLSANEMAEHFENPR